MTQEATGQQRHARHERRALGWPARSRTRQARSAREQALYDAALPAARAWSLAAALGLFLLGFAFDDARWVRLPGFALGIAGAFAALGLGSALVARRLARRFARSAPAHAQRALQWHTLVARLAAVVAVTALFLWLLVTSGGVPWT